MTSTASPAAPTAPDRRLTLVAMCVCQAMIMIDVTIVNVALPSIQRELGVQPDALEWVVNAYVVALAALLLAGGTLGDRFGRRRLLLIGLVVFIAGSTACALSPDDPTLVAARAVQGAGAALMAPLTLSILRVAYGADSPRAIGIWAAVAGIGFGAGPVIGGLLLQWFDWSAVFWVNVPVGLAAIALTLRGVQESRDPMARRVDVAGTILVGVGLVALVLGLIGTNTHGWGSARTLATFALAIVLLGAFVAWEAHTRDPMIPLALFSSRRFTTANLTIAFAYLGLAGILFYVTLYWQNGRGWSALEAGLSWIPMNACFLVASLLATRMVAFAGRSRVVVGGMLAAAAAAVILALAGTGASYLVFLPAFVLVGAGFGLVVPTASAEAMGAVSADRAGAAAGVLNVMRQVGNSVGLAALGSIAVNATVSAWAERAESLPPDLHERAAALGQSVAGGRDAEVAAALGGAGRADALDAFVTGMHAAMWVAAAVLAAGALLEMAGSRRERAVAATAEPAGVAGG